MSIGLIGTKLGMTREFIQSGQSVPVTVIKIETGRVIDIIEKDKRGYSAVKIGYYKTKNSKLTKQMKGFFTKKNTEPKRILKEYRVDNTENYKAGNELGLELLKDKKFVDVKSKTIGKGFAGAMKRHNFAGLRASHGVSISHRAHGSTEPRGNATAIQATVPLANMFGYINNLRSSTQGRAQYTMQFSHYDKVPQNVQDEVTKKLA